jgi:hypothetical protein
LAAPVSIASQSPLALVATLAACGVGLVLFADSLLAMPLFLTERLVIAALLWPLVPPPIACALLVASVAAMAIAYAQSYRVSVIACGLRRVTLASGFTLSGPALRITAAALALLIAEGMVRWALSALLPEPAAYAIAVLVAVALALLLLANRPIGAALGAFLLIDAARLLYALWKTNPWIWALWASCDLLMALSAARLHASNPIAAQAESER